MDAALQSYLVTALWSATDNSDESGDAPLDDTYGISDFAPKAIAQANADLEAFFEEADALLRKCGIDNASAAHNFWLTRNGHGAGFWDLGHGARGDKLSAMAYAYGSVDIYVGDDGQLYFR